MDDFNFYQSFILGFFAAFFPCFAVIIYYQMKVDWHKEMNDMHERHIKSLKELLKGK